MNLKVRHYQALFIKSCKVNISWPGMAVVRYIVFSVETAVILHSMLPKKIYVTHISAVRA
jgi:hypothetical protein